MRFPRPKLFRSHARARTGGPAGRAGAPPGEVVHEDVADRPRPRITVYTYGPEAMDVHRDVSVDEAMALVVPDQVTWINVDGLGDLDVLERLWARFEVHPLIQEDVVNVHQRPKFEEYEDNDYLVLHMAQMVPGPDRDPGGPERILETEQVSIILGNTWVLSFQETVGDVFDGVRERIERGRPRIRNGGPDYLAYALLDAVVDGFFPILETYGDRLEDLEAEAFRDPDEEVIEDLHELKRDFLHIRRALWPLRDATNAMGRTEGSPLISDDTRVFLRDVNDHVVRVVDLLETYRELSNSIADVYYSTISHRMNEVMKVLTIVATVFIPITFIAGVYGMNFAIMPELGWRYGYAAALTAMALVAVGMLGYFRRRRWL